jgi:hypothetical protein
VEEDYGTTMTSTFRIHEISKEIFGAVHAIQKTDVRSPMKNASQIVLTEKRIRGHLVEMHLRAGAKVNAIELELWVDAHGTAGEGTKRGPLGGANFEVAARLELLVNEPKEVGVSYTTSRRLVRYRQKMTTTGVRRFASRYRGTNERNRLFG